MAKKKSKSIKQTEKKEILIGAKKWFIETIAKNHIKNTRKLSDPSEFNINPFLTPYLANFLTGSTNPESIAKALIYARILASSITTSFGQNIQKFTTIALGAYGSAIDGIDIEFEFDGRKKYCQLKAGPNTINKDDIKTITGKFNSIKNKAKTDNLSLEINDMVVGVIYGDESELSDHYKTIRDKHYHPVWVGADFWTHLTGDSGFYQEIINAITEIADDFNSSKLIKDTIKKLAKTTIVKNISNKNQIVDTQGQQIQLDL